MPIALTPERIARVVREFSQRRKLLTVPTVPSIYTGYGFEAPRMLDFRDFDDIERLLLDYLPTRIAYEELRLKVAELERELAARS